MYKYLSLKEEVCDSRYQGVQLNTLSILLVKCVWGWGFKTQSVTGFFEILKMFYHPEGVCDSRSHGVQLNAFSILLV